MKFSIASALLLAAPMASAFSITPSTSSAATSRVILNQHGGSGLDLSGNAWKPDSEKMGSTDTGDYFPDDYNPDENVAFSDGMLGSQASLGGNRDGPQLPGLENLGEDAIMMGGIEQASDIPEGMEFIPMSVPDDEFEFDVVSGSSKGGSMTFEVKPFCMGFEDFYASFSSDSHPTLSVSPSAGRMDRRGGESSFFTITCMADGKAGAFTGDLVIVLPEDNSKLSYKVTAKAF
jgi:hypothetical protein